MKFPIEERVCQLPGCWRVLRNSRKDALYCCRAHLICADSRARNQAARDCHCAPETREKDRPERERRAAIYEQRVSAGLTLFEPGDDPELLHALLSIQLRRVS